MSPCGKRVRGPCGGMHEHVVSQFTICLSKKCGHCPRCGTDKIEPFEAPGLPPSMHCLPMGHVWAAGIDTSK